MAGSNGLLWDGGKNSTTSSGDLRGMARVVFRKGLLPYSCFHSSRGMKELGPKCANSPRCDERLSYDDDKRYEEYVPCVLH